MQDKDFLEGYEIRNLEVSPRMYTIFAIAALINFAGLFVIGQADLLSRSACESPFVNRICSVLDTVYFSSKVLTADTGYVVKEYQQTKIKDSEVVWIDQTDVGPALQYPKGYFQIANRDEIAARQDAMQNLPAGSLSPITPPAPITPPSPNPGSDLLSKKQRLPKDIKDLIEGKLPDDPLATNEDEKPSDKTVADSRNPENKEPATADAGNTNTAGTNSGGDTGTNTSSDITKASPLPGAAPEVEINKKPLYDFVDSVVAKVSSKRVDLEKPFKVVMDAYINKDGRLDVEKSRWIPEEEEGDPEMILVAKDAVEKIGDSGWLYYLTLADINHVRVTFYQDDKSLVGEVATIMPSENRARSTVSQWRSWVQTALFAHNNNIKRLEDDVVTLIRSAEFENEKNIVKIRFDLEKDVAHPIINTRIQQYQADKEKKKLEEQGPKQPNGSVGKTVEGNRAR